MDGTGIYIQKDLTTLNLSVLKATKGNEEVEKSWSVDGTIHVLWTGSDKVQKLKYSDYQEWLDSLVSFEGTANENENSAK